MVRQKLVSLQARGGWSEDLIAGLCRELGLIHCVDSFKDPCLSEGIIYFRLHGIPASATVTARPICNNSFRYAGEGKALCCSTI